MTIIGTAEWVNEEDRSQWNYGLSNNCRAHFIPISDLHLKFGRKYTFGEDIVMTFLVYACEGVEPHIQALHEI